MVLETIALPAELHPFKKVQYPFYHKKIKKCYNGIVMEGNRKNQPRALLVFGAPCSGKTTFAEKFAARFGLAFYDLAKIREENEFSRENILSILELIGRTGQTILIEGGLDTEKDRIEVRNVLREHGYEPSLIWVQTDIATIRKRMKIRFHSVSKAKDAYDEAVTLIEAPTETERPIILSGKHTFETQTRHVLAGLADLDDSKNDFRR